MATHKADESITALKAFLDVLDQDIDQGKVMPADAEYLETLLRLVEGVTVDPDLRLPDEDLRLHTTLAPALHLQRSIR